jgi:hypothetical protein
MSSDPPVLSGQYDLPFRLIPPPSPLVAWLLTIWFRSSRSPIGLTTRMPPPIPAMFPLIRLSPMVPVAAARRGRTALDRVAQDIHIAQNQQAAALVCRAIRQDLMVEVVVEQAQMMIDRRPLLRYNGTRLGRRFADGCSMFTPEVGPLSTGSALRCSKPSRVANAQIPVPVGLRHSCMGGNRRHVRGCPASYWVRDGLSHVELWMERVSRCATVPPPTARGPAFE